MVERPAREAGGYRYRRVGAWQLSESGQSTGDTSETPAGINPDEVAPWLAAHIDGLQPPLSYSQITGGHSNLTYLVTDAAGGRWVLRRPPLGQVLATAHDMSREHAIISALGPTDVPVPPVVGLSSDDSVNGAPFYVMDYVDGVVVRDHTVAETLSEAQRARAGESLVEVLGRIHAVDVDAVGLGELGRKEEYLQRQLKRWNRQFEQSRTQVAPGSLPDLGALHRRLLAQVPPQQAATIVHGDYRLDNTMLGPDGSVIAVLDWEICTLGDPLADVGLLLCYWPDPGDAAAMPQVSTVGLPGFPRRAELLDAYRQVSNLDLSAIDYYMAFGYWKLGCIIAGVYARYAGGSMGEAGREGAEGFRTMIEGIEALAYSALEQTT
ncbi:MAG: phosphotransferase family protein [Microthrixaceae bacterium]